MARIRALIKRYPVASSALAVVLLIAAGWWVYQSALAPSQNVVPSAQVPPRPVPPVQTVPRATRTPRTTVPGPAPAPPQTGVQGGMPAPVTIGRPDPFIPLVQPQSATGGGQSGGVPLPPVPPLTPGTTGPGGLPVPGVVAPGYRVVGILRNAVALAILEDGKGSYIVEPGDLLAPGVRVAAIDAAKGIVVLVRDGVPVELRLSTEVKSP